MVSSITRLILRLSSITLLARVSNARSFARDTTIPTDLQGTWTSLGCYIDVDRTLTDGGYDDVIGMTDESCIAYCDSEGYNYAGTEYFHECFCGDTLAVGGVPASPEDCSTPCAGDPTEPCGGPNRLNLFWNGVSSSSFSASSSIPPSSSISQAPVSVCSPSTSTATPLINLGAASTYAVLSYATVTNVGPTQLTGDIGTTGTSITGFPPGTYTGTKYIASAALLALTDGKNAYNQIEMMGGYELLSGNLAGQSLGPGVYKYSSSASLAAGGVLTLVGTGSSTDTWIFQIGSVLVTGSGSNMILSNGAKACNVYWQVGSSATLGVDSVFQGTVLAAVSVTADAATSVYGSLFGLGGSVTLDIVYQYYQYCAPAVTTSTCSIASTTSSSSSSSSHVPSASSTSLSSSSTSSSAPRTSSSSSSSSLSSTFSSSTLTSLSSAPSSTSCSISISISSSSSPPSSTSSGAPSSTSCSISSSISSSSNPLSSTSSDTPSSTSFSSSSSSPTTTSTTYTGIPTPSIVPSALNGYCVFIGCYTEASNSRALDSDAFYDYNVGTGMTVEKCAGYCGNDYDLFGVEYSGECYCGNTLQPGSVIRPPTECDMTCDGAPLEFCGGPHLLNVYSCGATISSSSPSTSALVTTSTSVLATTTTSTGLPTPSIVQSVLGYNYIGCYTEATNSRALTSATYVNYNYLTVQICASFCGPTYSLFGVEWSGECYCGDILQQGSVKVDDSQCNNLCDGNDLEYCGGGSRLNLYSAIAGTSTTSTSATAASATTSPISSSNSAFPNIGSYSYYGCQTEASNTRALNAKTTAYDSMTLESCAEDCTGYNYFGTEYGRECYCGNSFSTGSQSAPQDECTFPCAGNSAEICGAGLRLSVYSTSTPVVVATPSNPATVGNYDYYGCMTEGTNSRALQGYSTAYDTMTLASCAEDCAGFEYFGTEYARECYCGDSFAPGAVSAPEAECQNTDFLCMGDDEEFCGGSRILSVYSLA